MAAVSCVLSEDQFLCSICLEVFTDPVTTPCGHSFCNICINKHWDNCDHCHCPVCKEEFSSRPKLKISTVILEMVSEFKRNSTGAGDVLCDFCPEPKLKALKSCLFCQTSYCPNHLTPHNTVPRLKKHQLIAPVENLEERICPEHERLLDMFCRDHSHFMCLQCIYSDHKSHNTVPLKEQCEEEQSELQQKIQERKEKIQELQRSVELSQENADREMKEGVEFFNDLMKLVQQSLDQFKQSIEQKHQEIKEKAEELMKEVESEISALEQRRAQMEKIWKSDDHFHFVQTFTSVKPAPEMNDWTEVSVRAPSYEGRVAIAVSELLITELNPKIKKRFEDELKQAKKHAVDVTLDPDTAHPNLDVSQNYKQFSSGKFYYEVQVKGKTFWCLGVAKESVDRKVESGDTIPENGYWDMYGGSDHPYLWFAPEKVGVFVDYEEGLMCLFDAETSALLHSFTDCCFTGNILPLLNPCNNNSGKNSAPLILTPVDL
uniref:Uncharacterized protein n=1 Tax=Neogobius melanostomus TaxID=47308 RepID=A0A8C6UZM7_9GOBI